MGDGIVLCRYGSTHHPPQGLKPGDTTPGHDGQEWAFTGDSADGQWATYKVDKPRTEQKQPTEPPTKGWDNSWRYSNTFWVVRRDARGGKDKEIRPLLWDGEAWRKKAPTGLRPLLNLAAIQSKPDATILVVEGEKTCDAAARLFPSWVVTTWSGGSSALSKTTFSPLAGRKVVLWPDNDDPGRKAMDQLAGMLQGIGATSVKVVANPPDAPDGWDLADAEWTGEQAADWVKGNTTQAPVRRDQQAAATAAPGTGSPVRLKPNQVLELLPERVGILRLNIRSRDVHTDNGTLNVNESQLLYLKLSSHSEIWGKELTADAVALLSIDNSFDPVAEYLNTTGNPLPMEQWQRLDHHLLGIDDPIAAEFLPRYLIGAVARVFDPGCDVRQTPVLVGPQWRGKTALGRILFGAENWISGVGDLGREAQMKCHTAWGIELAELDGITRRSDQESLKAFLTETCDTLRRPYDKGPVRHPRRFVFWGTSNGAALRDTTGNTRYVTIPIPDRMLPLDWAEQHRNALWARAVEQYRAAIDWSDCSEALRIAIADRNDNFTEQDAWHDRIAQVLNRRREELQLPVTVADLLNAVQVPMERHGKGEGRRVRQIAESLGWVMERRSYRGDRKLGLWPQLPQLPQPCHSSCHSSNPSDTNGSGLAATAATANSKELQGKDREAGRRDSSNANRT